MRGRNKLSSQGQPKKKIEELKSLCLSPSLCFLLFLVFLHNLLLSSVLPRRRPQFIPVLKRKSGSLLNLASNLRHHASKAPGGSTAAPAAAAAGSAVGAKL